MVNSLSGGFLIVLLYPIVIVAAIVLGAWSLVMWIRVAYRWLRLHPAPTRDRPTDRSDGA